METIPDDIINLIVQELDNESIFNLISAYSNVESNYNNIGKLKDNEFLFRKLVEQRFPQVYLIFVAFNKTSKYKWYDTFVACSYFCYLLIL